MAFPPSPSTSTRTAMTATGFEFFVPGDVVPWARAGGGKTMHRFIPGKQAQYMATLKVLCQQAMKGAAPLESPVLLKLYAIYPWPASWSAKKRALPGARWKVSRPDFDNVSKIVGDALNAVAWRDDALIASAVIQKFYSENPGLVVRVETLA